MAEGLDPWYDTKKANPAHEVHRLGFRVLAGNRDLARKPQDKDNNPPEPRADNDESCECRVIPEVELKT